MKKFMQIVVLLVALASAFSTSVLAQGPDPWPTIPTCPITGCK